MTTAIFNVVTARFCDQLPLNDPDQLVVLHTVRQQGDRHDNVLSFMSLKEEESRERVVRGTAARRQD